MNSAARLPFSALTGLVDIHSHILPGIDDGPETLEESLEMARSAVAAGITTMAATPHLGHGAFPDVRVEEIADRCAAFQQAVDGAGIPLRVVSGAEATLVWTLEASSEELQMASYGARGTDLLVETPNDVSMLDRLLYQVRSRGFRVVLGHPERSGTYQHKPERLEKFVDQGILLQVNADAILAPRMSGRRRLAEHLCREGLASVLSSDGHRGVTWRPVDVLPGAVSALSELVGSTRAQWMALDVPESVLSGATLPEPPEVQVTQRRIWRLRSR